jgi:hypothetical protein
MSSRLTLLFLCSQCEPSPVLMSALESADFQLLVARTQKEAGQLARTFRVDAILVYPNLPGVGRLACTSLKRQVPRTPILLLTNERLQPEAYPGIYSVLHADVYDEVLSCAIALFLRECLRCSHATRVSRLATPTPDGPQPIPTPRVSA